MYSFCRRLNDSEVENSVDDHKMSEEATKAGRKILACNEPELEE